MLIWWQITVAVADFGVHTGFWRERMQSTQFWICRWATLATSERSSGSGAAISSGGLLARRLRLISILPLSPTKIAPNPGHVPAQGVIA